MKWPGNGDIGVRGQGHGDPQRLHSEPVRVGRRGDLPGLPLPITSAAAG